VTRGRCGGRRPPPSGETPRRGLLVRVACIGLAGGGPAATSRGRDGAATAAPKSSGPPAGTLLLIGGGEIGPEIAAEARRFDGGAGAFWVVVPTAAADADLEAVTRKGFVSGLGRRSAVLHTRDRAAADTDGFVAPLRDASAVWFEGGRQTRLAEAYAGTATEAALRGVLDRGGLMAGTSAGATIQGSYLVRGARGDIRAAPGLERAFGYLRNVAVDQHVDARNRDRDLVPLVAATPGLLGLGLDEGTAALVRGDEFGVVGQGRVLVTDGADHGGLPYDVLRPGDRFDLARRRRLP